MNSPNRQASYISVAALLASLGLAAGAEAGGLRCSVGEVVIENLAIGHTYSLATLANLPLSITSACEGPVRIAIEPLVPDASELRPGAEAIPDRRWATASPDTLELKPQETQAAHMELAIPDDRALLGRRFQVTFWTHTLPHDGELLAYGLKSRIIFSIAPTADSADTPQTGDLSLALQPADVRLDGVAAGKTLRLENLPRPLTVRNTSNHRMAVELRAVSCRDAGATMRPDESELLSVSQVRIEPDSLILGPGEMRTITGTMTMGSKKLTRGSNLVCIISAAVTGEPVRTQIYSRLYAHAR